jgi:hypothetical protein
MVSYVVATIENLATMPDEDGVGSGGGGGDVAEIDPTSIVMAFALTIALFPAIAASVVDPLLNQRTTLRDVLSLYRGERGLHSCAFASFVDDESSNVVLVSSLRVCRPFLSLLPLHLPLVPRPN